MNNGLRNLEPKRKMIHKFVFSHGYGGKITFKNHHDGNGFVASSLLVNLAEMKFQVNKNGIIKPIQNDDDAIERVCYNLNHEWMHYAFERIGENSGFLQEKMIYASIGNGGNEYFNAYYKINKNPEWEERIVKHK